MSKQPLRITDNHSAQGMAWQLIMGVVTYFCAALVLIYLTWFYLRWVTSIGATGGAGLLGLGILTAALAILIERGLAYLPLLRDWRYRLAFLGSAVVFCFCWLGTWAMRPPSVSWVWLLGALGGGFLGGLIATSLEERLWENNSPPSEHSREEVYQRHLEVIGEAGAIPVTKRIFDLVVGLIGLIISTPIWLISAFLVWFEDPGPILFVKNSVGKGGLTFHQFKFRTMVQGAEEGTGPILASEGDQRVLVFGKLLRKTALDELPQLINILRGEMSFVGPRPQRTVLVQGYLQDMPEYAERHRALPGLAGLAQVAGDYYLTPRQKLRFDRLYIQHSNLGFDLKLLGLAFLIAFWYRWQKNWDGRLPRQLLHVGSVNRRS